MIHRVQFTTPSGRSASGDLAVPRTDDAVPGLVLVHEWWGLNDAIRGIAERFAATGFLALAVDLYGGAVTSDEAEASALANKLETRAARSGRGSAPWRGRSRGTRPSGCRRTG